jgi:hypothetical protein
MGSTLYRLLSESLLRTAAAPATFITRSESYTLGHNSLDMLVSALFFLAESDMVEKEVLFDLQPRRTKLGVNGMV